MNILNYIWPYVGNMKPDITLDSDLNNINAASWGSNTEAVLEEARRLRDIETGRKNAAETKSQIYLATLLALIPILVSLTENEAFKGVMAFDTWYKFAGALLFVLGLIYGIGAFVSSFRSLNVRAYHRVDVDEIVSVGLEKEPLEVLAKEILKSVRLDRQTVNHKVSYVIVTHHLLFRMALSMVLAMALITFAQPIYALFDAVLGGVCD